MEQGRASQALSEGTEWPLQGLEGRAEQQVAKGRQEAGSVAGLIYNSSFQKENPLRQ